MGRLKADYLIVGAGAVGMAFADVLFTESDADIIIVDRYAKPGGHWNVAYPFVTLHQPSSFYGVSSRLLESGKLDETGLNKGMADLATGPQILTYFDDVMREQFLPSGRVRYFPMSDYEGDGRFTSRLTGETYAVEAKRFVDATWLKTSVPSTHTPAFSIAEGVRFMPLNDLPTIAEKPDGFTIIGGGKTGIDACLWLLTNGVAPDDIRLIMPRDAWMIDRANTQPGEDFFHQTIGAQAAQMEAMAVAKDKDDLFDRLEAAGVLVRLDPDVRPKMFHAATISQGELAELRRIRNVVRMGRISAIETDRIVLAEGEIATGPGVVHVDCSASAVSNLDMKPIFEGNTITPQTVRSHQPVFSAAVIAHIEATRDDISEKNRLCNVVPLPNHDTDWIRMMVPFMTNQFLWGQEPDMRQWLTENRLDGFSKMVRSVDKEDAEKQAVLLKMRENAMAAMANMQRLIAEMDTA
jgi:hypothetical protein